jgi:predicted TIM-barrel fold metal-dependent hydrolase
VRAPQALNIEYAVKAPLSRRSLMIAGGAALIGAGALASGIAFLRRIRRGITSPIQSPVRQAWLEKRHEEIVDPDLPIVDPHHHLWDRPGDRYLLQDFLADVHSGHNIRATLFEECGVMYRSTGPRELRSLGETEFATDVARTFASRQYESIQCCAGVIGYVDLRIGASATRVLEQHITVSDGRLRGVRNSSTWHPDPSLKIYSGSTQGLLLDRRFREGFAALNPLGLSFDAWMFQTQLNELVDLARAFPQTTIVLNHLGGPLAIGPYAGKRAEAFAAWRDGIGKVAACPNIHVKLGGLGMKLIGLTFFKNDMPPSSQELEKAWRPYIETCIEAFGPHRSMFESNFPVDKGSCSYQVLWNGFKRIVAGYSAEEKTALFSGAASKTYRIAI